MPDACAVAVPFVPVLRALVLMAVLGKMGNPEGPQVALSMAEGFEVNGVLDEVDIEIGEY